LPSQLADRGLRKPNSATAAIGDQQYSMTDDYATGTSSPLEYVVISRGVKSAFVDIISQIDLQRLLRLERVEYAASKSFCDNACVARWLRLACSCDRRCDKSRKDDGEPHR
jgi:hypothetical protein